MTIGDKFKAAKEGVTIIGEVIKAAGDNPDVKAAGNELGKTALTVTKTINNALLPLAAINFAFDKAREYFNNRFSEELAAKTGHIPPDSVVAPKASIAGPVLQALAFSHEETDLKEMYLHLLAFAMDGRVSEAAHPAFIEVVRQLSSEEAQYLSSGLRPPSGVPIVELRLAHIETNSWEIRYQHLLNLRDSNSGAMLENPSLPAYVDNWIRLGLFDVDYSKQIAAEKTYDWVEQRPEVLRLRDRYDDEKHKIVAANGVMARTSFGKGFASAVGIIPVSLTEPLS
jgi:Abortive infection alpha